MNQVVESVNDAQAGPPAGEMSAALREVVASYEGEEGLSTPEALARVREDMLEREHRALTCSPEQVTWADLEGLQQRDPEKSRRRWEEVREAARARLRGGHRAAGAVEVHGSSPWQRAEFLALREELGDGCAPRDGLERQLVDVMAQAQTGATYWLRVLTTRAARDAAEQEAVLREKGRWEPPRVTAAQAVEQAGAMAERFNRMFLRSLRALRDLRRGPRPVVVRNAGQVNVGQQQINVAPEGP